MTTVFLCNLDIRPAGQWCEDRYELVDVVMDTQLRFEARIELQKLLVLGKYIFAVTK